MTGTSKLASSSPAQKPVSRRRALTIFAGVAGLAAAAPASLARAAIPLQRWHGVALGAPATITLAHTDPHKADRLFERCEAEIARLENIFSLHLSDSEISRLNHDGRLANPSPEMIELVNDSKRFGAKTRGAFDISVQPLWRLFAGHFRNNPGTAMGPADQDIKEARAKVDFKAIAVSDSVIQFEKPGMAITMNGIAQGYITDRVADMLRAEGYDQVLLNLGEYRALGDHPHGRPWQIGLADPDSPGEVRDAIEIVDRAVATSGGYGTPFSLDGRHHHLFDPATGISANHHASVSVVAKRATTADALSTALCVLPVKHAIGVAEGMPGNTVYLTDANGDTKTIET